MSKIPNTETRAKVFAQYLGQPVTGNGRKYNINYQLILKPLSAITDEDANAVAKMFAIPGDKLMATGKGLVRRIFDQTEEEDEFAGLEVLRVYQYLQSKGYDVPNHLLGSNKSCGGCKTLKEAGLAVYEREINKRT